MVIAPQKLDLASPGLLVLAGCSGAGKSTLASQHFADDWVVSSDRCRWMLCGDEADQSVTAPAFALLEQIVAQRLVLRQPTVVDSTALQARDRAGLVALAAAQQLPVWLLLVWAGQEVCLAAQHQRERQVPEVAVLRMYERAQQTRTAIQQGTVLAEGFAGAAVIDRQLQLLDAC